MIIDPKRLRKLREAKGLSRADLAAVSKVSPKQIQRLEHPREASRSPRQVTVRRLAKALGVRPEVLAGQEPLPESDSPLAPRSVRVTHRLYSEALLAYDLVEKRYGVQATAIMNVAPLFFVLLAEGSLAWRRKELDEIQEAIDNLWMMEHGSNRRRFVRHASFADDHAGYEDEAINKRNLFDDPFPYDYEFDADDSSTTNPFVEYLQKLAGNLDIPGIEVGGDDGYVSSSALDGMPAYSVCKDELERIATNPLAYFVLRYGDVRLPDIPENLEPDDAAKQRGEWLVSKISKDTIQRLETLHALLKESGLAVAPQSLSNGRQATVNEGKEASQ
ncbi:MAG: helix-turn-helix transcriptional regulator [Rhodospirillaceae bacterium]|nr:helix-turn-helix transcriptional regulator [Rhodospirillaceae bacterium]